MRAQISPNGNPNAFYTQLVTAPYAGNAIISTHIYGPSVTHATTNYSGAGLDWRLSVSFGKKTLYVRFLVLCERTVPDLLRRGLAHLSAGRHAVRAAHEHRFTTKGCGVWPAHNRSVAGEADELSRLHPAPTAGLHHSRQPDAQVPCRPGRVWIVHEQLPGLLLQRQLHRRRGSGAWLWL